MYKMTTPFQVSKLASRHLFPAPVAGYWGRSKGKISSNSGLPLSTSSVSTANGGAGWRDRDQMSFNEGGLGRVKCEQFGISEVTTRFERFGTLLIRQFSKDSKEDSFTQTSGVQAMRNLLLVSFFTCACGGTILLWSYWRLRDTFANLLGYSECKSNKKYLYPFDPGDIQFFIKKHCFLWLPSQLVTTPSAWKLYQEIIRGGNERENAIAKLSCLDNLKDADCLYFALSLDLPTAIALAHAGADPRLFISPPVCVGPSEDFKDYFGRMFRSVLDPLPVENIHYNLNFIFRSALKSYLPTEEEEHQHTFDLYTGFDETPVSHSAPQQIIESRFLRVCLQATVSHTRDPAKLKNVSKSDLLDLLVVITQRYKGDHEIMSLVLRVLANVSCDQTYAEDIRSSGLLRILAECARDKDVKLVLPAKRALHNLDRESSKFILLSGIYQLYPDFRNDDSVFEYDIIFIHGILGGAFRTWRQQDKSATLENESASAPVAENTEDKYSWVGFRTSMASRYIFKTPVENPEEAKLYKTRTEQGDGTWIFSDEEIDLDTEHVDSPHTQCWPRDWLPDDCPNARVIAVDFDSFVTRWSGFCPVESTKRSLKDRSTELLGKLHAAGVGTRPIIWVTHSMGGLLAKSILCQATTSKEYQNICQNTKGVVFCSVPHTGSYIALASTPRRYIFMPTEEALELTNSDNNLTLLHERFLRLWRAYKFKVLSFGEMLETKSVFKVAFKMVPFSSADPDIGDFYRVNLNHLNTCKPHCRGAFVYRKIVDFIQKSVNK